MSEFRRFVEVGNYISGFLNGVSVGLAYIVSQGNITASIIWFAITTGATAGLSYYKEKQ